MNAETKLIEEIVVALSTDPHNPELNFRAACEYEKLNQTASAVSFYLRCAEFGYETHPYHVYTSLLKMARCFDDQNDRQWTVSGVLLQAVGYMPDRPEGWFLLSRFHERSGNWRESFAFAEVGLKMHSPHLPELPSQTEYLGKFCLDFEKAVSGWWIGRREESFMLLKNLDASQLPEEYASAVKYNLERINA